MLDSQQSPKEIPGKIAQTCFDGDCKLMVSQPIIEKITKVLAYPKINKIIGWNNKQIKDYIFLIELYSRNIVINNITAHAQKDKDDSRILATLLASNADYLVTGDSHLLALTKKYPIITPQNFIKNIW